MTRPGWTRLSAPGDKLSALWIHDATGWEVEHCGHPTANWPYWAMDPAHPGKVTTDATGRGFRNLARAFDCIERVLAGELDTYEDGPTKHGHRRIIAAQPPPWLAR